ncbi:DHHC family palmitoyltransferase [Aspergillus candidus]|uniref:Palmitoyltransferase n=1 Tax=Aspergillus candidus TaxID=41067 RepID=A0A2I2FIX0_ASPCN|nr:DHHC zinc finger membrane protein [Aspergillus candidus]PLB40576.1 DHHC zinc finger membrane protein [Aspergillus candidus]
MATLAASPPSSPSWPKRRPRAWALRCERYCCAAASMFPLAFVYGLTSWAAYVEISIGLRHTQSPWIGLPTSFLGLVLYICLNASYTTAVFTDPGSPMSSSSRGQHQYSALPVTELPEYTSFTVSSTGTSRYCKKCQLPKPDRAHHCSTCKRCVLKMDHHCPWLATCVGLYNYKAFLLFLIYTSLFCWLDFWVAAVWIWTEVFDETRYMETMLPVNVVLLAVLGGVVGLVLSGFTLWHVSLAVRNLTTIECLEKTRYVSPLRHALDRQRYENILGSQSGEGTNRDSDTFGHRLQGYGNQILDAHANAIPGVTRPEEGEERVPPVGGQPPAGPDDRTPAQQALTRSYAELERQREQDRYQAYLSEEENEKLPNAFDHGWRNNLLHLFGDRPLLWLVPVCTTTGDGWRWEPGPKFVEARENVRHRREQEAADQQQYYRDLYQRNLSNGQPWTGGEPASPRWTPSQPLESFRDPERPPTGVSMKTLAPMSPRPRPGDSDFEGSLDENGDLLHNRDGAVGRSASTSRTRTENEWRDWD